MSGTRLPRSAARVVDDAVRRAFDDAGTLSRAELGERTGLSRSALQNVVGRMLDEGELSVTARPDPQGSGRPAQRFRLTTRAHATPMVELQPDGSTAVLMADPGGGDPPAPEHAAAPWRADFPVWSASVADAVRAVVAQTDHADPPAAVVVSVPFPFAPGRGVPLHPPVVLLPGRPAGRPPVPDWLRTDPSAELGAVLGVPVGVVNDADLAGLAEVHRGAARGARTALYLALRDGIGAALVVDGRVTTGAGGMTGELAHVQVAADGPLCACGNRGCLATQTLAPSLVTALTVRYGRDVSFDDMEALVAHDDPVAMRFLVDLGRLVGGPLATIVGFLDPDVVVVDGGLGGAVVPVSRGIAEVLDQRCSPAVAAATALVRGRFGRAGPVGAGVVGEALAAGRVNEVLRISATPARR